MSSSSCNNKITCKNLTILTLTAVVIQTAGLLLFLVGFFPVKSSLSGISGLESFYPPGFEANEDYSISAIPSAHLHSLYQNLSGVPPLYDRLILMVIDGLPAEFVLGKGGHSPSKSLMEAMPYTQELLAKGKAIGYHAKAAPPTVTMPRLKAMVSGAIGGFLDVAFNFNTQAMLDDNIVGQFFRLGWNMLMFGDDTWLKLFPGMFTRHDGVSSFFVKDTVQVDHNVSRHLSVELNRTDWNLLILHYLGLDHVGHIGGRNSILMGPKLREMDEVISMIDLSIRSQKDNPGRTLLLIVSDHGMTENGNHGGSSFEETDALALFIGLGYFDYLSTTNNIANQVDIAPTLALLFGLPIPKNNVGFLMGEAFKALTDDELLRLMELNSWQLLRLLQTQLPELDCKSFTCNIHQIDDESGTELLYGSVEETFCCLYLDAASIHEAWKRGEASRFTGVRDCSNITAAYHKFLKTSSEWLARRVTDRPFGKLALGLTAMVLSCLMLLNLVFLLLRETHVKEQHHEASRVSNVTNNRWSLDEVLAVGIIFFVMLSMGSSSMVEEEQYIWYFMTSSLFLVFLRKATQNLTEITLSGSTSTIEKQRKQSSLQILSLVVILCCGRLMRAWHRGGVNWAHLFDISKWFEQTGSAHLRSLQLVTGVLLITISVVVLLWSTWPRKSFMTVIAFVYTLSGFLILQHMIKLQGSDSTGHGATKMAQTIYAVLGFTVVGTVTSVPWLIPLGNSGASEGVSSDFKWKLLYEGIKDSAFVVGWGYVFAWCLLQLLVQQPVNSMPLTLLFVQILATIYYSSNRGPKLVEVAALYYLGMEGHFGLGNTNTLATIDVAGAFIGVSSHSTLVSGILMFIITYASPMLALFSMVMYISVCDRNIDIIKKNVKVGDLMKRNLGLPCLLPLLFNSALLTTYTVILLLMRNHLFIWSVFSPKYLYACATTICVYIGVSVVASTMLYIHLVMASRRS